VFDLRLFFLLLIFVSVPVTSAAFTNEQNSTVSDFDNYVSQVIDSLINEEKNPLISPAENGDQTIKKELKQFYAKRNYLPIWSRDLSMLPLANDMIKTIQEIDKEGLYPDNPDYHLQTLQRLVDSGFQDDVQSIAEADILLSDAFFTLGHHLYSGIAAGMDLNQSSKIRYKKMNMSRLLRRAVNAVHIKESLINLSPKHPGYLHLKDELARYRSLQSKGGWQNDPNVYLKMRDIPYRRSGSKIKMETITIKEYEALKHAALNAEKTIKERLIATDDFVEGETLSDAIIRFQKRHGLSADGIVGSKTASKMAIPVENKIQAILLNMERWRWLPRKIPSNYIMVNIPDFTLYVIENDKQIFSMPVVVGKKSRKTPAFSAKMQYMVFNPYWRIPKSILKKDIVPAVKRDIDYLERKNIKIFSRSDIHESHPIDPYDIDWQNWEEVGAGRYKFRQDPGAKNALGNVKFIFPNTFDVYIHDTPSKADFHNGKNLNSSGCIRINNPLKLASHLMKIDYSHITPRDISTALLDKKTHKVTLSRPVPVYITYQTAWSDENGLLNFRRDVYDYDTELANHLRGNH